jgi:hypothetical protein
MLKNRNLGGEGDKKRYLAVTPAKKFRKRLGTG